MKISTIPQLYRNLNRWYEILAILSKYGLAGWISRFDLGFAKGIFKDRGGEVLANQTPETRIRLALAELGPTFIKLGQILSTRPDIVGVGLAEELQMLQTEVAADPPEVVRATIEEELGQPVDELFAEFDDVPLASASIGQVHKARLNTGEQVVVKVRHANIEQRVRVDLDIMSGLAQLAEKIPEFSNYRPRATAAEFQRTLRRELDFGREERHLQEFALQFEHDPTVKIPRSYSDLSTPRVLTMEMITGVKLSEAAKSHDNGMDLTAIARRGADLYLEMIFTHGFYHADPHPGNIILCPGNVIGLVDFGMVGRIDEDLRDEIEGMLLAIATQDAESLTASIVRLGQVPTGLDYGALSLDVADFVSHYSQQSLAEFNLSGALNEMTEMIRRYRIMLPARIGMLLKVLVMLEGTSRQASPNFSLMEVMAPHRRRMMMRRISPMRRIKKMRRIYNELEQLAVILPRRIMDILGQMQSGKFDVHLDHRGLEPSVNRLVLGLMVSALFLGSSLLLAQKVPPLFHDASVLGVSGAVVSLVLALRLLRAINKSGHLDRRN